MKFPSSSQELVLHGNFNGTLLRCARFVDAAEPGDIALVIGPSGAGKSRIAEAIGPYIFGDERHWPDGSVPFIRVVADNPDRGFFSPKELTRNMLTALHDPFRAQPWEVATWDIDPELKKKLTRSAQAIPRRQTSEAEMRGVIASIAPSYALRLIIIDEGNMMVLTTRSRVPTDYLEGIRVMAKKAGCCVLIFGTIDLLQLRGFSAQLNRAVICIHLERMRCEDEKGASEFFTYLANAEAQWSLQPGTLTEHIEKIFEWTYGVSGEVEALLKRASVRAAGNCDEISWRIISSCRPSDVEIEQIKSEADIIFGVLNNQSIPAQRGKLVRREHSRRMKPRRLPNGSSSGT